MVTLQGARKRHTMLERGVESIGDRQAYWNAWLDGDGEAFGDVVGLLFVERSGDSRHTVNGQMAADPIYVPVQGGVEAECYGEART